MVAGIAPSLPPLPNDDSWGANNASRRPATGVFSFDNASVELSGTSNFHHNSAVVEDAGETETCLR